MNVYNDVPLVVREIQSLVILVKKAVNDMDIGFLRGMETALGGSDEVLLFPLVGGG